MSESKKAIYTLRGYLHCYDADYKRFYICLGNDDFTERFLEAKQKISGTNPCWIRNQMFDGRPPGYFIKYHGKSKFMVSLKNDTLCTLDDLTGKHVAIVVQFKTYTYQNKSGWNLTCMEMCEDI